MYLHAPDRTTPFEETCRAMDAEWRKGKFARFGISNYRADEVEAIVDICEKEGFVKPSVYQGRYNAIIRGGEEMLFPILRKHGIAFYAYRSVLLHYPEAVQRYYSFCAQIVSQSDSCPAPSVQQQPASSPERLPPSPPTCPALAGTQM